jgi:hypothetical protein
VRASGRSARRDFHEREVSYRKRNTPAQAFFSQNAESAAAQPCQQRHVGGTNQQQDEQVGGTHPLDFIMAIAGNR